MRKYREDEVREIFQLATSQSAPDTRVPATNAGLTLPEIQNIGLEVGLAPEQVARAAAALDARGAASGRKSFGMPIEVGHTVPLPRPLTDLEWAQLVTALRTTFKAKGKIDVQGNIREWSNGNLHAVVEPVESGYRLRLGTLKATPPALTRSA